MPISMNGKLYEDEFALEINKPIPVMDDSDFRKSDNVEDRTKQKPLKAKPKPSDGTYLPEDNIETINVSSQLGATLGVNDLDRQYVDNFLNKQDPIGPIREARTATRFFEGTPVPPDENNASASSVEAPRPLPEDGVVTSAPQTRGIVDRLLGQTGERYQTWPEKAIRSAVSALALPGKVSQGLIDPSSEQAIEQSMDLAGLMVFGPAPVAGKLADGTLGSFIGVKAKTFDRNKLAEAQVMAANGEHPDMIWQQTGTFKGADGRWRQEIPDKEATIKQELHPGGALRLGDHLDHPELFKAYPELNKVDVVYTGSKTSASYNSNDNTIRVGGDWVNKKDVLLHEIQHAIQTNEGFAKGGAIAKELKLKYDEDINKAKLEARDFLRTRDEIDIGKRGPFTEKERQRIMHLQEIFKKEVQYRNAAAEEARWNYDRLAGEVEARNVETRMEADPNYLKSVPPIRTEDITRQSQYVSDKSVVTDPYGYSP